MCKYYYNYFLCIFFIFYYLSNFSTNILRCLTVLGFRLLLAAILKSCSKCSFLLIMDQSQNFLPF